MDARTPTCAREILNKLHIKQTITWSHANECIVYVNWTIMHLKHDSEFFGRKERLRVPYSAQLTFQSNVCYNSNRFGWIYYTRYCYSSLPNWSVCFVLRRTGFLLIYVIIYIIGICGYTKRSLIKSRFSWCIIYTTFIPIASTLFTISFFSWLRKTHKIVYHLSYDVMNDVVATCVTYQTKAHYITLRMR